MTNTTYKYTAFVQNLLASERRNLRSLEEISNLHSGYYNALRQNDLNNEKIDCIKEHVLNILHGNSEQKKASQAILDVVFKIDLKL